MPSQKLQKRIQATNEAFEAAVQENSVLETLNAVEDEALFTVDRAGSKSGRRKVEKQLQVKEKPTASISASEKAVLAKLQSKKRKAYGEDVVEATGKQNKRHQVTSNGKIDMALTDLWGEAVVALPKLVPVVDELSTTIVKAKSAPKKRDEKKNTKVKVAVPGQSYHPTPKDHQNALAEALAIELKRQEAIEANKKDGLNFADPRNRREITQLLLGEDNVDDEDDSEDEDEEGKLLVEGDEEGDAPRKIRKMKEKLTKAERNKKRARKNAEHTTQKIKQESKLLKSIDQIETLVKQNKKQEAFKVQQRKLKEAKRQDQLRANSMMVGISDYEVSAVPLSDELSGSLRTIIPKGVCIVDRTQSLLEKGEFSSRSRKVRKVENPHGARKVKWIPKYKYTTPGKEYIESLDN